MKFNKKSFSGRYGAMGDAAELAFEKWCIINDHSYVRRGWDRPPLSRFFDVHHLDRATPDFLLQTDTNTYYIECKGTIYDHVKIKQEVIDGLSHWDAWHPVWLFVWNSKLKKHAFVELSFLARVYQQLPKKTFDDGKEYYEFPIDWSDDSADIR